MIWGCESMAQARAANRHMLAAHWPAHGFIADSRGLFAEAM